MRKGEAPGQPWEWGPQEWNGHVGTEGEGAAEFPRPVAGRDGELGSPSSQRRDQES